MKLNEAIKKLINILIDKRSVQGVDEAVMVRLAVNALVESTVANGGITLPLGVQFQKTPRPLIVSPPTDSA